jgi:hypothetical protein
MIRSRRFRGGYDVRIKAKRWDGLLLCAVIVVMVLSGRCGRKPAIEQKEIDRITVEEVKARLEGGEAITFVDSRSASSWDAAVAKLPGAVRVPPHDAAAHVSKLPKGVPIVVYCT